MVECHIEVEFSMDKIIQKGHSMIKIIEVISEKEIFRGMKKYRGQNFRGRYRGRLRNDNLEEVEVGLEKDNSQATLGGMIESVVDKDQFLE